MLAEKGKKLHAVVQLVVDENALLARIEKRASESATVRADDNADALKKRLAVYNEQTAPIIPYYEGKKMLKKVDGMAAVNVVTEQIGKILG